MQAGEELHFSVSQLKPLLPPTDFIESGGTMRMVSDQEKRKAKERAVTELKRYAVIAIYLWVLFSLFEVHRSAVLRDVKMASVSGYRFGFAALNALIMGKVVLIGEALHLGERLREKGVIYSALFKSAIFAVLGVCFNIVEGVIVGLIHGKSIVASIPRLGGGGLEGVVLYGIMASVVLVPFFLFAEVQLVVGKDRLRSLILQKRSRADAA